MNSRSIIVLAALGTAAISFDGTAQTQPQTLNIIEHSSTSLTATLNGAPLTVNETTSDAWVILAPGVTGEASVWQEEDRTKLNDVFSFGAGVLHVVSEEPSGGVTGLPNGAADTTDFFINGSPLAVTFTDLGDTPTTVPDTTTTLQLFGLSLATLGILAKARPSTASALV